MNWKQLFIEYWSSQKKEDAAHDLEHFKRVAYTAQQIAHLETTSSDPLILLAAAYFHDLVNLPKNHPQRHLASRHSADKAKTILMKAGFPNKKIPAVCHAIQAHSFSAQIEPLTLEAKIIQDADRLEALGAIGILRTFYISSRMGSSPYDPLDPLAKMRPLDDGTFALDHFACKLFKLPDHMQTLGGRQIAQDRSKFLQRFVEELVTDLQKGSGAAFMIVESCQHAGQENQPFSFIIKMLKKNSMSSSFMTEFLSQLEREMQIDE